MRIWLHFAIAVQWSRRLGMLLLLNGWQQRCLLACVFWKRLRYRSFSAAALIHMAWGLPYEIAYSKRQAGRCSGKARNLMLFAFVSPLSHLSQSVQAVRG